MQKVIFYYFQKNVKCPVNPYNCFRINVILLKNTKMEATTIYPNNSSKELINELGKLKITKTEEEISRAKETKEKAENISERMNVNDNKLLDCKMRITRQTLEEQPQNFQKMLEV